MMDYSTTEQFWENQAQNKGDFSGFVVRDTEIGTYRLDQEKKFLDKLMQNFFGNQKNLHILDIGCARGHFVDFFSRFGKVVGFDFSPSYVSFCQKRFEQNPNIEIHEGNVLNFTHAQKFDLVFVGGVLPYVSDDDVNTAVENIRGLLKDGGVAVFREATMSKHSVVTYEGEGEHKMPCFRRTVKDYIKVFEAHSLSVQFVEQNYASTYTSLLERYRKFFHLPLALFRNKIIEFFLLYIPVRIFLILRKNMYSYNFIIVKKI